MSTRPTARGRALGLFAAALLVVAAGHLSVPAPTVAACSTHWQSRTEPPAEIRVLRTATGTVETVGFKRYVAIVMASGEWPTTLPRPVLEAGAQAVKQYAWYYALAGNHRDGYRTASGACYDVRDDSQDQVYRPETAAPSDKQRAARDELWGLSLRKNGRLFLTGYRAGSAERCGQDADGWRLYARSARDCAKRLDYDGQQILRAYYRPRLTFEWADGLASPAEDELAAPPVAPGVPDPDADEAAVAQDGPWGILGWLSDAIDGISDEDS